ncbi:hypothetical protein KC726_05525 [Candidatus Woesebacteria bacterium]|nr:hypothetical protein [Candidatus Woesebacteria bacterium]
MQSIVPHLQVLGLSEEEIEIYLLVLTTGTMTVLHIARNSHIPRTTVYLLIDSLIDKQLLQIKMKGKKKYYVATEPNRLIEIIREQQSNLEKAHRELNRELPKLEALYCAKHNKPKIRYYEGEKQVRKIYEETLNADEIYVQCMTQQARAVMGAYLDAYFSRVIRRMIHTKEIVSDSKEDKEYQAEYATERNQIICIPSKYNYETDYMIYNDNVAFITYKEGIPVGVVIEDKEIAAFERSRFLLIWESFAA